MLKSVLKQRVNIQFCILNEIVGNTEVEFSANLLSEKWREIQSVRQVKCRRLQSIQHLPQAAHPTVK
jgi:hypothetical protein